MVPGPVPWQCARAPFRNELQGNRKRFRLAGIGLARFYPRRGAVHGRGPRSDPSRRDGPGGFPGVRDVLVELDASTEQAQLAAAKADAELARATLERSRTLRASDYSSAAELDASDARAKQTTASVAQLQATIAKKTIRAPFDGRVAIRQVELGQVLSPGTLVASLQSIHPIHADFWLPQQALTDLASGMKVRLRTDVFPQQSWEGE